MVVDVDVARCLDRGSNPRGSILQKSGGATFLLGGTSGDLNPLVAPEARDR